MIDTSKLYGTRNTHNEEVLTLQTGDILESALDTGGNLALVLVAVLPEVSYSVFNVDWRMQLGGSMRRGMGGVYSYIVARS